MYDATMLLGKDDAIYPSNKNKYCIIYIYNYQYDAWILISVTYNVTLTIGISLHEGFLRMTFHGVGGHQNLAGFSHTNCDQ